MALLYLLVPLVAVLNGGADGRAAADTSESTAGLRRPRFSGASELPPTLREPLPRPTPATMAQPPTVTVAKGNTPVRPRLRVSLFSDSLGFEARDEIRLALTTHGHELVRYRGFPGTALCDFLPNIEAEALSTDVDMVVLQFSGNVAGRPCMKRGRPGDWADHVAAYAADMQSAAKAFLGSSARLAVVVAPEPVGSGEYFVALNAMYEQIADHRGLVSLDVREAFRAEDATIQRRLLCRAREVCEADGLVTVRSPDGVHFCPVSHDAGTACPVTSAGARRFAEALTLSLERSGLT